MELDEYDLTWFRCLDFNIIFLGFIHEPRLLGKKIWATVDSAEEFYELWSLSFL
jgi:hypothetical protein